MKENIIYHQKSQFRFIFDKQIKYRRVVTFAHKNNDQKSISANTVMQNASEVTQKNIFTESDVKGETKSYLSQQDLSKLLKYFSFTIQQRFDELDRNHNFFTCLADHNRSLSEKAQVQQDLMHKFCDYLTSCPKEIKLLEKLSERLMQIFDFFRMKCSDPVGFIQMQQKIQHRLKMLLRNNLPSHYYSNRPRTQKRQLRSTSYHITLNKQNHFQQPSPNQKANVIKSNQISMDLVKNTKTQLESIEEQNHSKVHVGQLFKYIFTILKRGYLLKLKMERKRKFYKKNPDDRKNNKIEVQGTGAILRTFSQKEKNKMQINQEIVDVLNTESDYQNKEGAGQQDAQCNFSSTKYRNMKPYSLLSMHKRPPKAQNYFSVVKTNNKNSQQIKPREVQKHLLRNICQVIPEVDRFALLRNIKDQKNLLKQSLRKNGGLISENRKFVEKYKGFKNQEQKCEKHENQFKFLEKVCVDVDGNFLQTLSEKNQQQMEQTLLENRYQNKEEKTAVKSIGKNRQQFETEYLYVQTQVELRSQQKEKVARFKTYHGEHQNIPLQKSQNDIGSNLKSIQPLSTKPTENRQKKQQKILKEKKQNYEECQQKTNKKNTKNNKSKSLADDSKTEKDIFSKRFNKNTQKATQNLTKLQFSNLNHHEKHENQKNLTEKQNIQVLAEFPQYFEQIDNLIPLLPRERSPAVSFYGLKSKRFLKLQKPLENQNKMVEKDSNTDQSLCLWSGKGHKRGTKMKKDPYSSFEQHYQRSLERERMKSLVPNAINLWGHIDQKRGNTKRETIEFKIKNALI